MGEITVTNRARRLVSVPCNSGNCVHMPGGAEVELAEFEVTGNAMIEKLIQRGVLAISEKKPTKSPDKKSPKSKRAEPVSETRSS